MLAGLPLSIQRLNIPSNHRHHPMPSWCHSICSYPPGEITDEFMNEDHAFPDGLATNRVRRTMDFGLHARHSNSEDITDSFAHIQSGFVSAYLDDSGIPFM